MKVEKHSIVCSYRGVHREISAIGLPGRLMVVMLVRITLLRALLGVRHLT